MRQRYCGEIKIWFLKTMNILKYLNAKQITAQKKGFPNRTVTLSAFSALKTTNRNKELCV